MESKDHGSIFGRRLWIAGLALLAIVANGCGGGGGSSFAPAANSLQPSRASKIPYTQLTWEDFPVNDTEQWDAYTTAYIRYKYYSTTIPSGNGTYTAKLTSIEITSGFDRENSWRKSFLIDGYEELLAHEQGHLDINEIYANRLRAMDLSEFPTGTGSTSSAAKQDLYEKFEQFFNGLMAEVQMAQNLYDDDTGHGLAHTEQAEWFSMIESGQLPGS